MNQKKKTTIAFACLASVAATSVVSTAIIANKGADPKKPTAENVMKTIVFSNDKNKFTSGETTQTAYTEDGNPIAFSINGDLSINPYTGCWGALSTKNEKLGNFSYFGNEGKDKFGGNAAIHGIQQVDIEFDDLVPKAYFDWKDTGLGMGYFIAFGDQPLPLPDDTGLVNYELLNKSTTTYKPSNPVVSNYFTIGGLCSDLVIKSITVTYSCYGEVKPEVTVKKVNLITDDTELNYSQDFCIETDPETKEKLPCTYDISLDDYPIKATYSNGTSAEVTPTDVYPIKLGDELGSGQGTSYRKTYYNYFKYNDFQTEPYAINVIDKTLFPTSAGTVFSVKTSEGEKKYMAYINCDDEKNRILKCMPYVEGEEWPDPTDALNFDVGVKVEGEKDTYMYDFSGKVDGVDSDIYIYIDYSDYSNPQISIKGNWGKDFDVKERTVTEGLTGKVVEIQCDYDDDENPMTLIPGMSFPLNCVFKTGENFTDKADPAVVGVKYEVLGEGQSLIKVTNDGTVISSSSVKEGTATVRIYANTNFPVESKAKMFIDVKVNLSTEFSLLPLPQYLIDNPSWECDLGGVPVNCDFSAYDVDQGITHIYCEAAGVDVYGGLYKIKDNTYWFVDKDTYNFIQLTLNKRQNYFTVDKCSLSGGEYIVGQRFTIKQADAFPDILRQYNNWSYSDDDGNFVKVVFNSAPETTGTINLNVKGQSYEAKLALTSSEGDYYTFTDSNGNVFTLYVVGNEAQGVDPSITFAEVKPMVGYESLSILKNGVITPTKDFPSILYKHTSFYTAFSDAETEVRIYLNVDTDAREICLNTDCGDYYYFQINDDWNEQYAVFSNEDLGEMRLILNEDYVKLDNADGLKVPLAKYEKTITLEKDTVFSSLDPQPELSIPDFLLSNYAWIYTVPGGTQEVKMNFVGSNTSMQIETGNPEDGTFIELWYELQSLDKTDTGGRMTFSLNDEDVMVVEYNEEYKYTSILSTSNPVLQTIIDERFKLNLELPLLLQYSSTWDVVKTSEEDPDLTVSVDKDFRTISLVLDDGTSLTLGYDGSIKEGLHQFTAETGEIVQLYVDENNNTIQVTDIFNDKSGTFNAFINKTFIGRFSEPEQFNTFTEWKSFIDGEVTATYTFDTTKKTVTVHVVKTGKDYELPLVFSDGTNMMKYSDGYYYVCLNGYGTWYSLEETNIGGLDPMQKMTAYHLPYLDAGQVWETTIKEINEEGTEVDVKVTFEFFDGQNDAKYLQILFDGKSRFNDKDGPVKFYLDYYDAGDNYVPRFHVMYTDPNGNYHELGLALDLSKDGEIYVYWVACYQGGEGTNLDGLSGCYFTKQAK